MHVVVVEVESTLDARALAQHRRGDGACRRVALRLQDRRERRDVRRQRVAVVVPDPVIGRQTSGQDRGVGGERQRHVAVGVLEDDGIPGQCVQRRRRDAPVSIRREVVRAEGVDGDQDDGRSRRLDRAATALDRERDRDEGGEREKSDFPGFGGGRQRPKPPSRPSRPSRPRYRRRLISASAGSPGLPWPRRPEEPAPGTS